MSDYATLQSDVQSAMGRSDIPSYVYRLANATINSEFRLLEMQTETTLAVSGESVALPADFIEVESLYIDNGGSRTPINPATEQSQATQHSSSGRPCFFAIHNGEITLMPVPDGDYTLVLRYYARQADFVGGADTNDVLTTYPGLYFYLALGHAAVWAKDEESAALYAAVYQGEAARVRKSDTQRRIGPTLRPRIARAF